MKKAKVLIGGGRVYEKTQGLIRAIAPMSAKEVERKFGKGESKVISWDERRMMPPEELLGKWGGLLLGMGKKGQTEAGAYLFSKVKGNGKEGEESERFRLYVPLQAVSGALWKVTEEGERNTEKVVEEWAAEGFRMVGNLHTHPWRGMPSPSGTDRGDWEKSPGVHLIIGAEGDVTVNLSVPGKTFLDVKRMKVKLAKKGRGEQVWHDASRKSAAECLERWVAEPMEAWCGFEGGIGGRYGASWGGRAGLHRGRAETGGRKTLADGVEQRVSRLLKEKKGGKGQRRRKLIDGLKAARRILGAASREADELFGGEIRYELDVVWVALEMLVGNCEAEVTIMAEEGEES